MSGNLVSKRSRFPLLLGTAAGTALAVLLVLYFLPFTTVTSISGELYSWTGSQGVDFSNSGHLQFDWRVAATAGLPPNIEGTLNVTCAENGTLMYSQFGWAGHGSFAVKSATNYSFSIAGYYLIDWTETYSVSAPTLR